jgi:hypothetical protein
MTVMPSLSTGWPKTVAACATLPSFSAIALMNLSAELVFSKSIVATSEQTVPSKNEPA